VPLCPQGPHGPYRFQALLSPQHIGEGGPGGLASEQELARVWADRPWKGLPEGPAALTEAMDQCRGRRCGTMQFILWILSRGKQYVHFIEPHGLMYEGINSPKIQFHKTIKDIEARLADPDVVLSSWILSWTPKKELEIRGYDLDEYLKNNVVFMEETDEYINRVFQSEILVDRV